MVIFLGVKMEDQNFAIMLEQTLLGFYHQARKGELCVKIPFLRDLRLTANGMHWHIFPEIFFQYEGCGAFCFKNEKILLSAGEICIIPRGVSHSEFTTTGVSRNIVSMVSSQTTSLHTGKADQIKKKALIQDIIEFKDPQSQKNIEYLDDIISIYFSDEWNKTDLVNSILIVYISHLIHLLRDIKNTQLPLNQKVYRCKRMVMNNLRDSQLSVASISKKLDCSADYLSNLFYKEEGVHLSTYISQRRIHTACEYLSKTPLNINQIAKEVGFSTTGYFIKVFKKLMEQTPKNYRDIHKTI